MMYEKLAVNVVTFKIVYDASDIDKKEGQFKPIMTHQVFRESESIFGYRFLSIAIYYMYNSSKSYVDLKTSGKIKKDLYEVNIYGEVLGEFPDTQEDREFKTHPSQWKFILDFMEEHPSLIKPKFSHPEGDAGENNMLWTQLTNNLNAMGFGVRTTDKWKAAVSRWKSKTKGKAAQLRLEGEKTGGGPSKALALNESEERLMALLGWKAITGDKNVELGMPPLNQTIQNLHSSPIPPMSMPPLVSLTSIKKTDVPPKRPRYAMDRTKRFVSINKMHSAIIQQNEQHQAEKLKHLKKIDENSKRIGDALEKLVESTNKIGDIWERVARAFINK